MKTTVNLIGNGTLELLRHPDQWHHLRTNPALIERAVEELLRYHLPCHGWDGTLGQGGCGDAWHAHCSREMVWLSLLGANTDPQHFPAAEALDITREENEHLAFGKGIHYCLGAPLHV